MLVDHVSWESETGHTRLPGTLHKKVRGKVLTETIQVSPVRQSGHHFRLWGREGWLGLPAGEKRSPLSGGGGGRTLEGNLRAHSGKGMECGDFRKGVLQWM